MCGRLRVGKENLTSQIPVGCSHVFGLICHMTAGHNALRGSGPGHKLAFDNALAHVGCPDRRIDRLCITCCSPYQPSRLRRMSARLTPPAGEERDSDKRTMGVAAGSGVMDLRSAGTSAAEKFSLQVLYPRHASFHRREDDRAG